MLRGQKFDIHGFSAVTNSGNEFFMTRGAIADLCALPFDHRAADLPDAVERRTEEIATFADLLARIRAYDPERGIVIGPEHVLSRCR